MGDRMFASGGDSVHVGRRESRSGQAGPNQAASWEDRWNRGPDTGPREIPADVDATAGVVRRLQARVDRHRWLLARMQSDPLQPEPAGLPELLETVARMRRDTESLLMLHGQDPGVPPGARPRRLADVLAAATAAAEEPRRVDVRTVPPADVTPAAATELLHVLAEVVDHVTAVYPGARVDVSCVAEAPGGVLVEVRADGATRHDPDGLGGRRALGAARRLAQRSQSGIVLRSVDDGARAGGPVASIHCPGSVVVLDPAPPREPDRSLAAWSARRHRDPDPVPAPAAPPVVDPLDPLSGPLPLDRLLAEPTRLEPPPPGASRFDPTPSLPEPAHPDPVFPEPALPRRTNGGVGGNGNGRNGHGGVPFGSPFEPGPDPVFPEPTFSGPTFSGPTLPGPTRSGASPVDELFGPMLDLAHDPADDDVATPIFEAVASAWFREDEPAPARHHSPASGRANGPVNGSRNGSGPRHGGGDGNAPRRPDPGAREGGGPRNWETPSDVEWRAAAERAARPEPEARTSTGLPRRRPGDQLVPPPRGGAGVPEIERPDRAPDRVRDRLSTYQRGLRQGRHRADPSPADSDPGDPAAW